MPQHHTTADQVVFVGEWFESWSELQRSNFLPSLVRELRPAQHVNGGLHDHLQALNVSNRPPSIFHCQVKLFHDWVCAWSPEERTKLIKLLRDMDAAFSGQLDTALAELDGEEPAEEQDEQDRQQAAPLGPPPAAVAAVAANAAPHQESDVDEALESSPSSTLSSPHPPDTGHPDSGLDSPVAEPAEEDEGGHAVVMDRQQPPAAAAVAAAMVLAGAPRAPAENVAAVVVVPVAGAGRVEVAPALVGGRDDGAVVVVAAPAEDDGAGIATNGVAVEGAREQALAAE